MQGKRILLGVCGGIAAYKACELARELMRAGAEVQVVLTPAAAEFVTPLTFTALTGRQAWVAEFESLNECGTGVSPVSSSELGITGVDARATSYETSPYLHLV